MATVNKDFRVKNGLVVEGTTGTIDGNNIVTDADTSDILSEGAENLFYTDDRVKDVLTGAVQENISITVEEGVLTIAAENGVDDSTTDDLDEGTTNLYHTDERVRGAVSAGDGLSYDSGSGEFSADLGNGLGIDAEDKIEVVTGNGLEIGESSEVQIDTAIVVDLDSAQAISNKELGTDLDADGFQIVNLGIPQNSGDAATKEYVDAVSEGLHIHASVAAATEENIDLASPPSTIDGVTLVEGMRILVKDQTNASQNGIYAFESGNLVRAEDHDTAAEIQAGDFVFVEGGTTYNATGWVQLNSVSTLGTDPIEWTQFLGAGTFVGGNGIEISGQEISIDFTEFDTDDIDEGETNLYYTDQRVEDVISNSDTDDLSEGTTNLYFTDERAVDALEAVTPNFTEIEINSVSKQVAATFLAEDAESGYTAYSFDPAEYRSAKYLVKAAHGSHTQISEILLTIDTSENVYMTEYAIVTTNGILIDTFAEQSGGQIILVVNAVNTNTTVTVFGTLIA